MENITSIGFELQNDQTETENFDCLNMCSSRNFPYYELLDVDTLHLFDTSAQKLVLKTQVVIVDRFTYSEKQEFFSRYPNSLVLKYYYRRPDSGCQNLLKEFDFGDLKINEQTNSKLVGQLDGNNFEIKLSQTNNNLSINKYA